jgi:ElaB/YqjD/DUF883 family membrane-anchored ribosome-binding protein
MIQRGNGRSKSRASGVNRLPEEREATPEVMVRAEDWRTRAETWIAEHPLTCIAAALTLGATIGWLIKRR